MRFSTGARNGAQLPAASARATLCGWKPRCRSTNTKSPDTINVWEAGLDRYCKLEKPEFIGRDALLQAKGAAPARVLAGLEMTGEGSPADGYRVLDMQGAAVGYVTSGFARPVSEEEHRAGLCSSGVRRARNECAGGGSRPRA